MKPGIYDGLSNKEYHLSDGLSASGLKEIARSPAHYHYSQKSKKETFDEVESPALKVGKAVHTAVLEPEEFEKRYCLKPESKDYSHALITLDDLKSACETAGLKKSGSTAELTDRLKKANLDLVFFSEIVSDLTKGKVTLSRDEWDMVLAIRDATHDHPMAQALLRGGKAEQSIFWEDPETGLLMKCRPDFLRTDGIVIDLKTATDASEKEFERSIMKFKYHWQSAHYLDGVSHVLGEPTNKFLHLCVEKTPPYAIAFYILDDASLDLARQEIRHYMRTLVECQKSGSWPSYPSEIQNISLPHWAF